MTATKTNERPGTRAQIKYVRSFFDIVAKRQVRSNWQNFSTGLSDHIFVFHGISIIFSHVQEHAER